MKITVDDLLRVEHVEALRFDHLGRKPFSGVSLDSRSIRGGEVFFAIAGEKVDGHLFVEEAFRKGASCAVVEERALPPEERRLQPLLIVRSTTRALGRLANLWRKKFDIPCLAVAGSNGKTTTKELIASVLKTRYRVLATPGNQNNHIGVPQTLFQLGRRHEVAVIEIGTNHFGELAYLCEILEPTHGLITNIGREHLEFFGDLEGVAKAEGELFESLSRGGIGFVNMDDRRVVKLAGMLKKKVGYGFAAPRPLVRGKLGALDTKGRAEFSVAQRARGRFTVRMGIPGTQAALNGLAAAAAGLAFGVPPLDIGRALSRAKAVERRMEIFTVGGVTIMNDTYNANPDSVLSSLETLRAMPCRGRKIVILADMLELGSSSAAEHKKIGEALARMKFEYVLTFGGMAQHISQHAEGTIVVHYDEKNMLSEYAAELLSGGDIILVKGSRGMRMEDVVTFLRERLAKHPA
jgi:UDP-N-acetylmuramoyl-tripeptide--D-alanyl-D-alanine ligase